MWTFFWVRWQVLLHIEVVILRHPSCCIFFHLPSKTLRTTWSVATVLKCYVSFWLLLVVFILYVPLPTLFSFIYVCYLTSWVSCFIQLIFFNLSYGGSSSLRWKCSFHIYPFSFKYMNNFTEHHTLQLLTSSVISTIHLIHSTLRDILSFLLLLMTFSWPSLNFVNSSAAIEDIL